MTYAAKGRLSDWTTGEKNAPLTPAQQMQIMHGVANGVAYIHKKNVIHRDIKPDNVLLDDQMNPMLGDFGLSLRIGIDDLSVIGGTAPYIAPELLLLTHHHSEKSDIYAFSLLCWCIIARAIEPYNSMAIEELKKQVAHNNLRETIPSDCPENVKNAITKGWDRNPDKRPDAEEILRMLNGTSNTIRLSESVHSFLSEFSSCCSKLFINCNENKVPFTRQIL